MRVLLVMPTPFENGRLGLENVVWLSEPVALTSVGTAIQDRHEVRVLDLRLEEEDALVRALSTWKPDVVGTTSMTTDAYQAKAVLRTAKNVCPDVLTLVGGHHPTLCPDEFDVDYVDVIVQGEGEHTLREIMERWTKQREAGDRTFDGVRGTRWRDANGVRRVNAKREQTASLDDLPVPNRRLIEKYQGRYFFTAFRPMASIFTSRGCSFDCNFCAIWEFYERRTRFLSAKKIVDQMEACAEPFVFVLDDNFLTNKRRVVELCDEMERRGLKKYWMTQGRTDFAADNPELVARLAKNGLVMLLSGFESNDDDNLAALRKKSSWQKNLRANEILRENGVVSTGIFMVRPDWTKEQFAGLYDYVNSLDIGIPLFTILTPLPGTQLYRAYRDKLLTDDHRLFDLLHAVLPTRLPREEFYGEFCRAYDATEKSVRSAYKWFFKARPTFIPENITSIVWFYARTWRYQRIHRDHRSFLRDEEGLLNGPGAKAGLTWEDIAYPKGDEHVAAKAADDAPAAAGGKLVKLRIPRRIWADDVAEASAGVGR
ncbi:MAG: cobalamin-dependent protein [Labilithrix sp.]|nr:cobalamin-dependent protein [Labilithrix sp.]MCW5837705.1 cobalamin-dependent protein [Labilithrix sp.]